MKRCFVLVVIGFMLLTGCKTNVKSGKNMPAESKSMKLGDENQKSKSAAPTESFNSSFDHDDNNRVDGDFKAADEGDGQTAAVLDKNWETFEDFKNAITELGKELGLSINVVENKDEYGTHKAVRFRGHNSFVSFTGGSSVQTVGATLHFLGGEENLFSILLLSQAVVSYCGLKQGDPIVGKYMERLAEGVAEANEEDAALISEPIGKCQSVIAASIGRPVVVTLKP